MNYLTDETLSRSLNEFEYTRLSVVNMNRIVDSKEFKDMDSEKIFHYLLDQMELISFADYLRRYLYERFDARGLSDKECVYLLEENFAANRAPKNFRGVGGFPGKKWFQGKENNRNSVFLLGFGLKMSDEDVSAFLTKALLEQDFNFNDRRETIFWHCFHNGLPYSKAVELMNAPARESDPEFWVKVNNSLKLYLSNEPKLLEYISCLPSDNIALEEFRKLYDRALAAAAKITGSSSPSDIENILCCGIPKNKSGNLEKLSGSKIAGQFRGKRMSRQRLGTILRQKVKVDRFDVITLLFLVYSIEVEPDWPTERFLQYIDEVNDILGKCHMAGIYPVNPYESFVLMCLLSEEPLSVYSDVWEMSYEDGILP